MMHRQSLLNTMQHGPSTLRCYVIASNKLIHHLDLDLDLDLGCTPHRLMPGIRHSRFFFDASQSGQQQKTPAVGCFFCAVVNLVLSLVPAKGNHAADHPGFALQLQHDAACGLHQRVEEFIVVGRQIIRIACKWHVHDSKVLMVNNADRGRLPGWYGPCAPGQLADCLLP